MKCAWTCSEQRCRVKALIDPSGVGLIHMKLNLRCEDDSSVGLI